MKFTCNQKQLSKAINIVSKAVSNKTTLPILNGILLEVKEDGTMRIAASDKELSIENTIDVSMSEPGAVVVGAKLFLDIIRKLPNEEIFVEEAANNIVTIKTDSSEFTLVSLNADEFPSIIDKEIKISNLSLPKDILKDMIRKTSFAASIDESKGILLGVLLELKEDKLNMVALDGFRMSIVREDISSEEEKKIVISARILNEINKIITESEDEDIINIQLSSKRATLKLGDTIITTRLLDGEYLNYESILPKESRTKVIIERNRFIESIERASILARGKNNLIKIKVKNNLLTLTSRSEEGNVREEIIVEKTGEDIEIGFNSKYLIESLKALDEDLVVLTLNTSISPALIRPLEGDSFDYLILPVRITSTN